MTHKIIVAGFGGQGIILTGTLLAHAGMVEGMYVSHIPSYGAEMRGGTANCSVILSDEEIASPLVPHPDILIVMNQPSLIKFEPAVVEGGRLFINRSLIDIKAKREDIKAYYIPANSIAEEAGGGRSANMVMIGALLAVNGFLSREVVKDSLEKVVSKRNLRYNPVNIRAIDMGYEYVKNMF